MTDNNSLFDDPKLDEFKTESPLRAFASFDMFGNYLIAKGFRPSLGHLTRYLDAMEKKEGWQFVQLLEAATGVPTMIFRKVADTETAEVSGYGPLTNDMVLRSAEKRDRYYVVEYLDNKTKTVIRNPVAEWPQWAQELVGAPTPAPAWSYHLEGLDPEKVIWNRVQWRGEIEKLFDVARERQNRVKVRDFLRREEVTDMRHYYRTASVASVLRLIDMLEGWEHYGLDEPITDEALFKAIGRKSASARGGCREVTSDPVGVLESMAEDMAEELGLEVDRESFDLARKHLSTMVSWTDRGSPIDIPEEYRRECAEFVIRQLVKPEYQERSIREFEKSFLNPKGTPISHKTMARQLIFHLSGNKPEIIKRKIDDFRASKQEGAKIINHVRNEGGEETRTTVVIDPNTPYDQNSPAFEDDDFEWCCDPSCAMAGKKHGHFDDQVTIIYDDGKTFDDANPAHYGGWACGDIGERLSPNGYQILKYCWRLGRKDDPCKELGKALRYLDREVEYLKVAFFDHTLMPNFTGIDRDKRFDYLLDRTADQSQFTADVARFLWNGYTWSDLEKLKAMIADQRAKYDCGSGLAI